MPQGDPLWEQMSGQGQRFLKRSQKSWLALEQPHQKLETMNERPQIASEKLSLVRKVRTKATLQQVPLTSLPSSLWPCHT